MLPGISFAWTGRIPPRPPPGASNERYSPRGNFTDRKRHANTFSRKFRVAAGSVLESSENAIVPSIVAAWLVFRFAIRNPLSVRCSQSDIHWIVYRPTRGRADSGEEPSRRSWRSRDHSPLGVSGRSDPGEREASGSEMDSSDPARHGLPEVEPIRPDPPEQSRTHAASALSPARPNGGRRPRGSDR